MRFIIKNPVTGKKVLTGELLGDTFVKKVKSGSKLKILDAYGIEASVVEDLKEKGCRKILLIEDGARKYQVNFDVFYAKSMRRTIGNSSYQFYLPLKYWERVDDNKKKMEQLSIFDVRQGLVME
ncbi:hypothetical protein [Caldanaerobacter subterraneus]|uniref:hypothetical protein n=1 Tax=Caldanaerobacter subterraneus TaxID=911092 RepID=UPI0019D85092|nr:hypothetical protein [Caldanaerobacter subterraneus]